MTYVDTSVLVAYYCAEPLSARAERMVRAEVGPVISDLTEVEFFSALSRKARAGELEVADAARIGTEFLAHLQSNLYRRVPMERRHFELARSWMARLGVPIRTLDALHLAVAAAERLPLATLDRALARTARTLGVRTT